MPFFYFLSFLALLFVAFLLLVGWFVAVVLLVKGRQKQSRSQVWVAGASLSLISLMGMGLAYACLAPPNANLAYKDSFGVAPSKDVTELQASEDSFGDYTQIYLRFKTSPKTIQTITAKGWKVGNPNEWANSDGEISRGDSAPDWWKPKLNAQTQVFSAEKRLGHFSSFEQETLIYDAGTGEAFYDYDGLD